MNFDKIIKDLKAQKPEDMEEILEIEEDVKTFTMLKKIKAKKIKTKADFEMTFEALCYGSPVYCVPKGTLILMGDLSWKPIEKIKDNEQIIGITRQKRAKKYYFNLTKNKVLGTGNRKAKVILIKTDKGSIEITPEHKIFGGSISRRNYGFHESKHYRLGSWLQFFPFERNEINEAYLKGWLCGYVEGDGCFYNRTYVSEKQKARRQFKIASNDKELLEAIHLRTLKFGIKMIPAKCFHKNGSLDGMAIYKTEEAKKFENLCKYKKMNCKDFHRGYLAGIYDAEGSQGKNALTICQKKTKIISHIKISLNKFNFKYTTDKTKKGMIVFSIYTFLERVRFLMLTRPVLERKTTIIFEAFHNRYRKSQTSTIRRDKATILSLSFGDIKEVYNLETETKNYIANGFVVHNCCGLSKPCMHRNAVLDALGISLKDFRKIKMKWHEEFLRRFLNGM